MQALRAPAGVLEVWWIAPANVESERILSSDERAQANKFATRHLRQGFVDAHVGLRRVLAEYSGENAAALMFSKGAYGKPELLGRPDISFNLSHSGEYAVCVVADGMAVGVDIEHMKPLDDVAALALQVFSDSERYLLSNLGADEGLLLFYDLWVRKEAVIKALGLGFSYPAKEVVFSSLDLSPRMLDVPGHGQWWVSSMHAPEGYAAACSCRGPFSVVSRNFHDIEDH